MEKTLVILLSVCAIAHTQLSNNRIGSQSGFGLNFAPRATAAQGQSQYQQTGLRSQQEQSKFGSQQQQSGLRSQQQQSNVQPKSSSSCAEKNERYPVPGSCDRYIECLNGTAEEKTCPDGLRFNPNVNFNAYPCQYPNEVTCLERSSLQPADPTDDCPHQFGYFKLGDERNCSIFRTCVSGVGFDFTCPEGLAFSSASYRCEWPDEVADCDAEAFLGFRCPEIPQTRELGPPAGYRFYRSNDNCQKFFMCIENKPRIMRCGGYSAYDELSSTCVSADQVEECPQQLREQARFAQEDEKQRLAKELEFSQSSKTVNQFSRRS